MRKAGGTLLTTVSDGTVYYSPGGGYVTSGHSSLVLDEVSQKLEYIKKLEKWTLNNTKLLADKILNTQGHLPEQLQFELTFEKNQFAVIEVNSLIAFTLAS